MKWNTLLISIALLSSTLPMMAEVDNAQQNVSVTDLTYMIKEGPKSELGTVVGAVLDVLADQTKEEQPGYVDAVQSCSPSSSPSTAVRLIIR